MRKIFLIFIGLPFLFGCKKEKSFFAFNDSMISQKTIYDYSYDSGRINSQKKTIYNLRNKRIFDSTITKTAYRYNNRGLLIKKISKTDFEMNPIINIYKYNSKDSLIREITISPQKDTVSRVDYKYFPDGRKKIFHKYLSYNFDSNKDNKQLDTLIWHRNEYRYKNDLCQVLKKFDSEDNLINKIEYSYKNGLLDEETHYIFLDSLEIITKTKHYDYSKSIKRPNFYTINNNRDTIERCFHKFDKNRIIEKTEFYDFGEIINKSFFNDGKIRAMISIDKSLSLKIVDKYDYYDNGNLKEIKKYNEKIVE
jgi:hypothetical protein